MCLILDRSSDKVYSRYLAPLLLVLLLLVLTLLLLLLLLFGNISTGSISPRKHKALNRPRVRCFLSSRYFSGELGALILVKLLGLFQIDGLIG